MKWLVPTIIGGVVLAIGMTFTRTQRAAALAAQVDANAQVETARAAQSAVNEESDDAVAGPNKSAPKTDQPESSADAAPATEEKKDTPRGGGPTSKFHLDVLEKYNRYVEKYNQLFREKRFDEALDIGKQAQLLQPANPMSELMVLKAKFAKAGDLDPKISENRADVSKTTPPIQDSSKILILPVEHRDAASLVELIKRMHPKGEEIYADSRTNSLIFPNGVERKYLEIVRELDQPEEKTKTGPASDAAITARGNDVQAGQVSDVVKRFLNAVHLAVPKAAIQAVKVNDSIMLLGQVNQPEDTRKIVEIGELHFMKVLNYLEVRGAHATPADTTNSLTELPIVGRTFASNQAPTGDPPSPAAREYQQFETQCLALAAACREQQAAAPQDAKRFEQLKNELQGAVHSAFHARQSWQRGQAAQLRERLEQIERRISERSQLSNEIIQRRVEELLNPQQQWEPATDEAAEFSAAGSPDNKNSIEQQCWETLGLKLANSNASQLKPFHNRYRGGMLIVNVRPKSVAAGSGIKKGDILVGLGAYETVRWDDMKYVLNQIRLFSGSDPLKFYVIRGNEVLYGFMKFAAHNAPADSSDSDREPPTKLMTVDSNADGRPLEHSTDAKSDPVRDIAQHALRQAAGDPRRDLLNAEAAVASAEAAIAESKAAYERSAVGLKRVQALYANGAVSERAVREADADVERGKAALTRAKSALEIKQRMLQGAREMLALEIKLREADLEDAKARMDHAAAELARFEALYKQKAISQEVFEAKRLPQQLAASQYERAKMLLDLYQKAVPSQKTTSDATSSAGPADTVSNDRGTIKPPKRVDFNLSPAADDPRKRVLDATHAITAARAAVVEAEVNVAEPEQTLKRMQLANSKVPGTVPQGEIARAEQSLASTRASVQSKRVDLEINEQQLEEAREALTGQIKLLELDLADAKLRMQHADDELSVTVSQYGDKHPKYLEKLQEHRLTHGLAASQYQRAQLLLELYRKALPDSKASTNNDQSPAEPLLKGVWMSDFAAAEKQALKLHRPLVVYFWAQWSAPDQRMKAEVIPDPNVVRILDKNFVAVIVNVDRDPKTVKQFNIQRIPTVLVLNEGRELARTEGLITATKLGDELKKVVPLSRTEASADVPAKVKPAQPAAEEKSGAPRPGSSDAVSDEKPPESTPKAGDQSNGKPEE